MHPAFGEFLDDCSSIKPTSKDFQLTHALAEAMAGYFPSAYDRITAFTEVFQRHASLLLHGMVLKRNTMGLTLTVGPYVVLNVQPAMSRNTSILNLAYYADQLVKLPVPTQCRMPAFLISLEGMPLDVGLSNIADIYVDSRTEIEYFYGCLWGENHG